MVKYLFWQLDVPTLYKESSLFFINPGICVNIILTMRNVYLNDPVPTGHNLNGKFAFKIIASLGWNDIILKFNI